MCISNDPAKAVVGADRAIVGTLRSRVAIIGPAERPCCELGHGTNHRVLLLNSEPRFLLKGLIEYFLSVSTEVRVSGLELLASAIFPSEGLGHDDDVVSFPEGVAEEGNGPHDNFRIFGASL